ncbi:MAG TPA: S-methyl-5'-thioadenosine phosphorylase [Candidatus Polarisedimenticolaceae bacterium]|nr:S-methyl-5'-thioadenosine phosphorylase [Candidatus Polarisedimenticolaceae bacterium]
MSAEIGIIGGSGLYDLPGLEERRDVEVSTPFGAPSGPLRLGRLHGRALAFLARHGAAHTIPPGGINYRANVFALKQAGVKRVISVSAVGSMREQIHPRDVVLVDQFVDRTQGRAATFFGEGLVAHVSFAEPVCPELRGALLAATRHSGGNAHDGGTYLCIEGPAFSTRAESKLYRSWGVDVIGMTNLPEARLAREAELCYATLALVTDYDCWHEEAEDVSVAVLLDNLRANSRLAAEVLGATVRALPTARQRCECGTALRHALVTPREAVAATMRERLAPLIGDYLDAP